jgi:hypothetical protein
MPLTESQTEQAALAMRNAVIGSKSTDKNWDGCKDGWMRDLQAMQRNLADAGLEISPVNINQKTKL